jgi:hypothetical protein
MTKKDPGSSAPPSAQPMPTRHLRSALRFLECAHVWRSAHEETRLFAQRLAPYNGLNGLKSMISGQFFIGSLVGVGCRLMVLGPSLGTPADTLDPTPMCAYQAHIVLR